MLWRWGGIFLAAVFLWACSNSEMLGGEPEEKPFIHPGLGRVKAIDREVVLGTNDTLADPAERPAMRVRFTYDFYLGYREVSLSEYREALGLVTTPEDSSERINSVTYYDAVLFANAVSRKYGFDTVYTYTQSEYDVFGSCISLAGLETHYEVEGFRLPTEAEWMLAATDHWDDSCDENGRRFCAFSDGLKEWVNDWLGLFQDTTVENYVGSAMIGNQSMRVLKGGSFRDSRNTVHPYGRMDVYSVTSDMKADYVGIRLAFGAIPNYTMTDIVGRVLHSNIRVTVDSRTLRDKLSTMSVKLVFRNDVSGNLVYVNFISGSPIVHEIVGEMEVYHPEISPDGKWAVFSTVMEGVSDTSNVFSRMLNPVNPVLRRLPEAVAAIPRWRMMDNGEPLVVYVTDAGNNRDSVKFKKAETWQIKFVDGGFRQKKRLFSGAYHDGVSDDGRLAVTGARLLRAHITPPGEDLSNGTDTVWYGGEQACNVSLARDGSKRTLFLDFGGKTGREFTGRDYGVHEMLLVVDSLGHLVQGIPAPAGYSFDHTEWVPGKNMAVATLADMNGVHRRIVLVDLSDSSIVDLVEGEDLGFPSLWTYGSFAGEGGRKLDPDSAGVYMRANGSFEMALYRYKLELLWRYRDSADVVVLGSSRSLSGFDPMVFTNHFAINLSQTPNSLYLSRDLFKRYVLGNVTNLRYLIVSLDIDLWYKIDAEDNFFNSSYQNYPGFVYDENHNFWKDDRSDRILRYTESAIGSEEGEKILYHRGLYAGVAKGWPDEPTFLADSTWNQDNPKLFEDNLSALEDIIRLAKEEGIVVVGVIFPQNPAYAATGSFGRYGLTRSEAPELIGRIASLEEKFDNFHLVDENKMGVHDYTNIMAENDDHLCRAGARQLSSRLNSLIKSWDAQ